MYQKLKEEFGWSRKEADPSGTAYLTTGSINNDNPGNTRHRQDVEPISNQERDFKDIYSQDHSKRRKLGLKKSPTDTIWKILSGT